MASVFVFSVTLVTNHCTLAAYNNSKLALLRLWRSEVGTLMWVSSHWAKNNMLVRLCSFLEGSMRGPLEAAGIPRLMAPFKASQGQLSSSHMVQLWSSSVSLFQL